MATELTPEQARRFLTMYSIYFKTKMDGRTATSVVEGYLRELGFRQRRPTSPALYSEDLNKRWEIGRTVARYQVKLNDGSWHNKGSHPLIDAAWTVLAKAADAVGDTEAAAKYRSQGAQRGEDKAEQKRKRADKTIINRARTMAYKMVESQHYDWFRRFLELPDGEERGALKQQIEEHVAVAYDSIIEQVYGGGGPSDQSLMSLDRPTLLPLLGGPDASWKARVDGVDVSIRVMRDRARRSDVNVAIGAYAARSFRWTAGTSKIDDTLQADATPDDSGAYVWITPVDTPAGHVHVGYVTFIGKASRSVWRATMQILRSYRSTFWVLDRDDQGWTGELRTRAVALAHSIILGNGDVMDGYRVPTVLEE